MVKRATASAWPGIYFLHSLPLKTLQPCTQGPSNRVSWACLVTITRSLSWRLSMLTMSESSMNVATTMSWQWLRLEWLMTSRRRWQRWKRCNTFLCQCRSFVWGTLKSKTLMIQLSYSKSVRTVLQNVNELTLISLTTTMRTLVDLRKSWFERFHSMFRNIWKLATYSHMI